MGQAMNPDVSWFKKLEGQVIDGKYHLKKLLGAGGFGAVFQANEVVRDRVLGQVAVKVIPPADTPEAQAKQLNELLAARNLDHPHVIRCFAAGEFVIGSKKSFLNKLFGPFSSESGFNPVSNGSFLYLVMELADYSLDSHLRKRLLSGQPLHQMIDQVANALNYLHINGLVHQDLKPGNVLWVKNVWKVSDFGTVRSLDTRSHVQTRYVIGTPLYMSPEALRGVVSSAWDMWSLGVMVAVAATGEVPEALPEDSLPIELRPLVRGCLQDNWRQRWTAKQALDAMAAIKLLAPSTPAVQPSPKPPAQPIQPIFTDTAPTIQVNPRPFPVPQQKAPKPLSPIIPPSPPAPAPHQDYQKLPPLLDSHQDYQELLPGKVLLEMIAIPAGSFLMGSPDGEGEERERPQHRVTVPQFYMGKYPVTNAQWRAVMQSDPSAKRGEEFRGDRHPVVGVTWRNAQAFCQKLTQLTRRTYRLPSEAEWEYACRAGSQTKYSFGDDENQLKNYAWYRDNSNSQTHPVGEKKPSNFGLYDMHGNVWEWCEDHWHDNYRKAPTDGSAWINADNSNQIRILRGGSWLDSPRGCRSAYRVRFDPDYGYNFSGFRVVCAVPRILQ